MKQLYGSASWPTSNGNALNTRASIASVRAKGKTSWSTLIAEISKEKIDSILVGEDGCIFADTLTALFAIEPNGNIRWKYRSRNHVGFSAVLADGNLVCWEGAKLVSRDQKTGQVRWASVDTNWARSVSTMTADGTIIHDRSFSEDHTEIAAFRPQKGILWSYRLSDRWPFTVATDDLIVVTDGSYLAGLNYEGQLLWLTNRNGFISGESVNGINRKVENEGISSGMIVGSQIVAKCEWYDGSGLFIFDPSNKTVKEWPNQSDRILGYPKVICTAPEIRVIGTHLNILRCLTLEGELVFKHEFPAEVGEVICDAEGKTFAISGFDQDYWEKYRVPYGLDTQCGIWGFDSAGKQIFHWISPGPNPSSLAVGKAGEIYCACEGSIWAIG